MRAMQESGADDRGIPPDTGAPGRRYILKGGAILSMDGSIGDFVQGDVLIEGKKIVAVAPNLDGGGATVINAAGMIVMPGFVDTHKHQYQTALRSFLSEGLLMNDGLPHGERNYLDYVLFRITPVYRPEDAFLGVLVSSLSQIDAGVTTVVDTSQVGHTPDHTDAVIAGLQDADRRAVFVYSAGAHLPGNIFPNDLQRIRGQYFSSTDQLLTLAMAGEVFDPAFRSYWAIGRENGLRIVSHLVGSHQGALLEQIAAEGFSGLISS